MDIIPEIAKSLPLVSVVTPSYNHFRFVRDTIESVVNQTYSNIEYFVIDDGSSDGSSELIETLSKEYGFYFHSQANQGLIPTMNTLMGLCNGKYIAIIESDDIWSLDKIEKQVSYMENHPDVGACGGNVLNINDKGVVLPHYFQQLNKLKIYDFKDVLSFNYYLPSMTMLIRKEVIQSIGSFDEKMKIVDLFMWLRITWQNIPIVLLPDFFGYYRIHPGNTSKDNKLMFQNKLYMVTQYKKEPGYKHGLIRIYLHYYTHQLLKILPKRLFPFRRS